MLSPFSGIACGPCCYKQSVPVRLRQVTEEERCEEKTEHMKERGGDQ